MVAKSTSALAAFLVVLTAVCLLSKAAAAAVLGKAFAGPHRQSKSPP